MPAPNEDPTPAADAAPGGSQEGAEAGADASPEAPARPSFSDRLAEVLETDDDALQEQINERTAPFQESDDELDEELEEGEQDGDEEELSEAQDGEDEEGGSEPGEEGEEDEGERGAEEPEGDEEGERDEEVDDEGEEDLEGDLDDYVVLDLPARREGDPDFQLPVDKALLEELGIDPDDAVERIQQLRNGYGYMREAEEVVSAVQEDRDELDLIFQSLESDPTNFLVRNVAPKVREEVVDQLILELDDDSFEGLVDRVSQWARNPQARDTARTQAENERLTSERDAEKAIRVQRQVKKQLRDINTAIVSLVPESMNQRVAGAFRSEAAAELQKHVQENKLQSLDPAEVPTILADRGVLDDFGVSPNGERSSASTRDSSKPRKKKRSPAKSKKASDRSASSSESKTDVRERLRRRKSAASTPAGAGSAAPAGFKKVPGERHEDKMDRLRRHLGMKPKNKG